MTISLIAARTKNQVIGKNNDLPWHLPDDMKYFMHTTKGHHVIMGRKNYQSLPQKFRPLPGRINIVVTRQAGLTLPGCRVVHSVEQGLEMARKNNETEVFIIGGAEIYRDSLKHAQKMYLTEIDASIEGDTFFPAYDRQQWKETSRSHHPADDRHAYAFDFVVYQRIN